MRLIDADVALDFFKNKYSDITAGCYPFNIVVWDLVNYIEKMPIAYNMDKVVEELEALAEKHMANSEKAAELGKAYEMHTVLNGGKGMAYEHAIDIVKKGGVE